MNFAANLKSDQVLENNRTLGRLFDVASRSTSLVEMLQSSLDILLKMSWLALQSRGGIFLVGTDSDRRAFLRLVVSQNLGGTIPELCSLEELDQCLGGSIAPSDDMMQGYCTGDRYEAGSEVMYPSGYCNFPIRSGDRLVGVLVLYLPLGSMENEEQASFLRRVAGMLSLAISLRRKEVELERRNRELTFKKIALDEHAIVSVADVSGKITYANDKFCEITGFSREELIGRSHRILNSGYHPPEFWKHFWETISSGKPWHGDVKNKRKDGTEYWVRATVTPFLNGKGQPFQYIAIRTDITQQKEMEAALLQAQRVAKMGSWTLDARTGASVWSEETYRILGVDPFVLKGGRDAFLGYIYKEDVHAVIEAFRISIDENLPYEKEYRIVRRDTGQIRWVHEQCLHQRNDAGQVIRSDGTVQDITERKKVQAEITRLALTDQLTGVANRNYFNMKFDQSLKLASREGKLVALLLLDLDKFKPINDTFGHLVGDAVLQGVANVFRQQCRETDVIARLGGDEFAILLIHPGSEEDVARVAERIINEVRRPMQVGEDELRVGVSIGVAMFPEVDVAIEGLIKKADLALYEAKDAGRNCIRFYRPSSEPDDGAA